MGDDFWHVVLIGAHYASVVVFCLNFSLTGVVTLPVKLTSRDFDELVEVQATREHAKKVDKHFEVVQVRVDTVGNTSVLDLKRNSLAVFEHSVVNLTDTCSGKREEVDLAEVLLPVFPVSVFEDSNDLLYWHNVSFRAGFLHGIADNGWEDAFFRS